MQKSILTSTLTLLTAAVASVAFAPASALAQAVKVDPGIKPYEKTSGVTGNLNSIGSDTLNNLMTLWAEGFKASYPNVNIQIEGKGSSTAPPALIEGTAQLGPMSRDMKATRSINSRRSTATSRRRSKSPWMRSRFTSTRITR
jgi:phosphate transport system substrate-binding protein